MFTILRWPHFQILKRLDLFFPMQFQDNKAAIYCKFVHKFYMHNKLNKTNYNIQSNIVKKTNVKKLKSRLRKSIPSV